MRVAVYQSLGGDDALQNFTSLLQWCMQFKLEVNKPCSNKFLQEVLSLKPVPFDHIGVQSLYMLRRAHLLNGMLAQ